jgi:ABC-type glycerol-3-phosphate transport system permease component
MFLTSFKSTLDIYSIPPKFFIFKPSFANWADILIKKPIYYYLYNSIAVAAGTTFISMVCGSIAAYALARFRIKYANEICLFILLIFME